MSDKAQVQIGQTSPQTTAPRGLLQRQCACGESAGISGECSECQDKKLTVQRKAVNTTGDSTVPRVVHDVINSTGQPLDKETRAFMEPRFGHSFSQVRVHTDERAAESAQAVSARAYTVGRDVVFGMGHYAPATSEGRKLLAHELSHVVQQSHASPTANRITSPNDSYEQEADQAASSIDASLPTHIKPSGGAKGLVMRDIISANPSPSGGGGHPPTGLPGCKVFLGGRRIDHAVGYLGFRHLYIDTYEGPTNYALIEGGPVGSSTTGHSGAWVKNLDWDSRGIQWDITPQNCPGFVGCLKRKTADYHAAGHPYHYRNGPNSNSFAWWVLNECGVSISTLVSFYPYLGVDYWRSHPAAAPAPSGTPAPATP